MNLGYLVLDILKNHVFPDVVCSGVIQGHAKTRNLLNKYTNLTRTDDGKVYADGAQVIVADTVGTNGVLHIIDDVLVPDEGDYFTRYLDFSLPCT